MTPPAKTGLLTALLDAQKRQDPHAEGAVITQLARMERAPSEVYHVAGTLFERFFFKLAFGLSDCWYWTANIDALGYGRHSRLLGEVKAHRFAYRYFKGPIPRGMVVMHTCDVRHCVNPDHLVLGTQADNVRDMCDKGRAVFPAPSPGERNGMAKLTWEQVEQIRTHVAGGRTQKSTADEFGMSPMAISRIVRRESWR